MKRTVVILTFLFAAGAVAADSIQLKSGKTITGTIVSETDDALIVDMGLGVDITVYRDDVESMDAGETKSIHSADDKYVKFIPVVLFDGMGGNNKNIYKKTYDRVSKRTKQVSGIKLKDHINESCIFAQRKDNFFLLFYNFAEVSGCHREFLIQRVMLEKRKVHPKGNLTLDKEYFVEVLKVKKDGWLKEGDEHFLRHKVSKKVDQFFTLTVELGCGKIPDVATGFAWPFKKKKHSKVMQDYSSTPAMYNDVEFDFSETMTFAYDFGSRRKPNAQIPGYACVDVRPLPY